MIDEDCELYFIQFCFCRNRSLLLTSNRDLYDALLKRYAEIYVDLPKDLEDRLEIANRRFIDSLFVNR